MNKDIPATVITPDGETAVPMSVTENSIAVTVPKTVIGADTLYLKACDSREAITSAEDFYDHGDVLPMGYADFCLILK